MRFELTGLLKIIYHAVNRTIILGEEKITNLHTFFAIRLHIVMLHVQDVADLQCTKSIPIAYLQQYTHD